MQWHTRASGHCAPLHQVGHLLRIHLAYGDAHWHASHSHVVVLSLLGHHPLVLRLLQLLKPDMLLQLLLHDLLLVGRNWRHVLVSSCCLSKRGESVGGRMVERTAHPVDLLLVSHHLLGIHMLHGSMGVGGARRHSSHESAGADLGTGARNTQMCRHLMGHGGGCAGLAGVVGHARSHVVAGRSSRMLLHSAGVRRKGGTHWHASHHLFPLCCRLSTAWIST